MHSRHHQPGNLRQISWVAMHHHLGIPHPTHREIIFVRALVHCFALAKPRLGEMHPTVLPFGTWGETRIWYQIASRVRRGGLFPVHRAGGQTVVSQPIAAVDQRRQDHPIGTIGQQPQADFEPAHGKRLHRLG
ncbi:MAG: hypothetical protein ACK559_29825, partial [bacterium]